MTDRYVLHFWKLDVQDLGTSRFHVWWSGACYGGVRYRSVFPSTGFIWSSRSTC